MDLAGRIVDLDSHLMLRASRYGDVLGPPGARLAERFASRGYGKKFFDPDEDEAPLDDETIYEVKGVLAPGAGDAAGRIAVLDAMGIDRQLLFPQVIVAWPRGRLCLLHGLPAPRGREASDRAYGPVDRAPR